MVSLPIFAVAYIAFGFGLSTSKFKTIDLVAAGDQIGSGEVALTTLAEVEALRRMRVRRISNPRSSQSPIFDLDVIRGLQSRSTSPSLEATYG
jgi:hypothetical protein